MEKRCPKCETKKNVADFYANKAMYDGLSSWCADCERKRNAEASKTPERKNQPAQRKRWADAQMRIMKPRGLDY